MLKRLRSLHEPTATTFLVLVFGADLLFSALYVALPILDSNRSLCGTWGICAYMDVYNLIKLFGVVILFTYVLRLTKHSSYASWIFMFACFFVDDALLLHQTVGDHLAQAAEGSFLSGLSLPPRYFELAVLAIAGIFLLAIVAWAYVHSGREFRKTSNDMFLFLAALVFFGLVVDVATSLHLGHSVRAGMQVIEDVGEMLVDSLILWYVLRLAVCNGKPDCFLLDLLRNPDHGTAVER